MEDFFLAIQTSSYAENEKTFFEESHVWVVDENHDNKSPTQNVELKVGQFGGFLGVADCAANIESSVRS
jgi:hypothetical protein